MIGRPVPGEIDQRTDVPRESRQKTFQAFQAGFHGADTEGRQRPVKTGKHLTVDGQDETLIQPVGPAHGRQRHAAEGLLVAPHGPEIFRGPDLFPDLPVGESGGDDPHRNADQRVFGSPAIAGHTHGQRVFRV